MFSISSPLCRQKGTVFPSLLYVIVRCNNLCAAQSWAIKCEVYGKTQNVKNTLIFACDININKTSKCFQTKCIAIIHHFLCTFVHLSLRFPCSLIRTTEATQIDGKVWDCHEHHSESVFTFIFRVFKKKQQSFELKK